MSPRRLEVAVGVQNVHSLPNPAPGAPWVYRAPAGSLTRVVAVIAELVTNAEAGERFLAFHYLDQDNNTLVQLFSPANVAPSRTAVVCGCIGSLATVTGTHEDITIPLPDLILPAGYALRINEDTIKSTDQWQNVRVWVEEFEDRGAQRYAEVEHIHAVIEILQGVIGGA